MAKIYAKLVFFSFKMQIENVFYFSLYDKYYDIFYQLFYFIMLLFHYVTDIILCNTTQI